MNDRIHPNFKKALAFSALLLLLTSQTGCWKQKSPDATDAPATQPPTTTQAPETVQTEPPVTTEAVPETTAAPTEAVIPTETTAPTEAPTEPATEPPETESVPEAIIGIVNTTRLNIREKAGLQYAAIGSYYSGDSVEILETKDGWGRTEKGWVFLDYLDFEESIEEESANPTPDGTEVIGYGVVNLTTLNVRSGPGTNYEAITTVPYGKRYPFYQEKDGWVKLEKGWVSTSYFYVEGKTDEGAGIGFVHSANPNIRSGPGLEFEVVGSYQNGETIKILAQINKWGYTEKGWVNMAYVGMKQRPTGVGVVIPESLNIRKQAKVESTLVGTYAQGEQIEILETNGDWGRTDLGWVHLDYVQFPE